MFENAALLLAFVSPSISYVHSRVPGITEYKDWQINTQKMSYSRMRLSVWVLIDCNWYLFKNRDLGQTEKINHEGEQREGQEQRTQGEAAPLTL